MKTKLDVLLRWGLYLSGSFYYYRAYGIRNKEAKGSRIDGVPYPGTFLVDREGVIREKLFFEGYKKRHHAKDILKAAAKLPKPKKKAA